MTRTMYNHKATDSIKAAKNKFRFTCKTSTVQKLILEGMSYHEIKHEYSNYDTLYRGLDQKEVHVIQNWVINQIDEQRLIAVKNLLGGLNKSVSKASQLQDKVNELEIKREEFSKAVTDKETYIKFIADMLDCSESDVEELAE